MGLFFSNSVFASLASLASLASCGPSRNVTLMTLMTRLSYKRAEGAASFFVRRIKQMFGKRGGLVATWHWIYDLGEPVWVMMAGRLSGCSGRRGIWPWHAHTFYLPGGG
jgi:hypothetical protein